MRNRGAELAIQAINENWQDLRKKLDSDALDIFTAGCRYGVAYWYDFNDRKLYAEVFTDVSSATYWKATNLVYLGSLEFDDDMLDLYDPNEPEEVENIWMNFTASETLGSWLDYWEEEVKREW